MWGYAKKYNMGTHLGIWVRYVDASIPTHIGEIIREDIRIISPVYYGSA